MTTEAELFAGYADAAPQDILIEVDDRLDAETIHAALTRAATEAYRKASIGINTDNKALRDYHLADAARLERLLGRFTDALWPEPEPDREGDPHLNGAFGEAVRGRL